MSLSQHQKFYWGASTSSHQVEGNNHNDWTEWEEKNAARLSREAESLRQNPAFSKIALQMLDHHNYVSGAACDHYHRYKEDFDIAKSLGHNAHRFSIEWSRIEPEKGKWNEEAIQHYCDIILALKERGLEPFVTLYHWTVPLWFRDEGGWLSRRSPTHFESFVRKIAESYKNLGVTFWITLNEPEVYAGNSFLKGEWPPQVRSLFAYVRVMRHLTRAHKKTYRVIKKYMPNAQVGIAKNNIYFEAVWWNPVSWVLKLCGEYFWNHHFLRRIRRYQDFIGLNYYFHSRITWWFGQNKNLLVTDIGWEIYPEGLQRVLTGLRGYKKPIYITENGLADQDDGKRADFIRDHITAMRRAMKEGTNVRGYLHWSLTDNFEWAKGFAPRFGLVAIDYKTMERSIRKSAFVFKDIIEHGHLPS